MTSVANAIALLGLVCGGDVESGTTCVVAKGGILVVMAVRVGGGGGVDTSV